MCELRCVRATCFRTVSETVEATVSQATKPLIDKKIIVRMADVQNSNGILTLPRFEK